MCLFPGVNNAEAARSRVPGLSDAVFAVAVTLLVLDLRVPDLGSQQTDARLQSALLAYFVLALEWIAKRTFELRS